jgi:hypothetical protein
MNVPRARILPSPQQFHEGVEQLSLGNNAHQLFIAHDWQATDPVVGHDTGCLLQGSVLGDRDHLPGHDLLHRAVRSGPQQILLGDNADEGVLSIQHGQVAQFVLLDDAQCLLDGDFASNRDRWACHSFNYQHFLIPSC